MKIFIYFCFSIFSINDIFSYELKTIALSKSEDLIIIPCSSYGMEEQWRVQLNGEKESLSDNDDHCFINDIGYYFQNPPSGHATFMKKLHFSYHCVSEKICSFLVQLQGECKDINDVFTQHQMGHFSIANNQYEMGNHFSYKKHYPSFLISIENIKIFLNLLYDNNLIPDFIIDELVRIVKFPDFRTPLRKLVNHMNSFQHQELSPLEYSEGVMNYLKDVKDYKTVLADFVIDIYHQHIELDPSTKTISSLSTLNDDYLEGNCPLLVNILNFQKVCQILCGHLQQPTGLSPTQYAQINLIAGKIETSLISFDSNPIFTSSPLNILKYYLEANTYQSTEETQHLLNLTLAAHLHSGFPSENPLNPALMNLTISSDSLINLFQQLKLSYLEVAQLKQHINSTKQEKIITI